MNSPRALTFNGRLPGVVCQSSLPPAGEAPLRLDVAGFAGFAERGPLNVPVALEDFSHYTAVFGKDLMIARDGGRPVYAHLPGAVAAFFDNGGRRCYVVRVADEAAAYANRFAIPGLVVDDGAGSYRRVVVEAASPGRWSDRVSVSTQVLTRPLPVYRRAAEEAPLGPWQIELELPSTLPLGAGDLLALTFSDAARWLFPLSTVQRLGPAVATTRGERVLVEAAASAIKAFGQRHAAPLPAAGAVARLGEDGWDAFAPPGSALLSSAGVPAGGAPATGEQLDLIVPAGTDARPGDLLRVACAGGEVLLFPVERLSLAPAEVTTAAFDLRLSTTGGLWESALPAGIPRDALAQVDLLSFELTIAEGDDAAERFTELRFAPGAGYWADALAQALQVDPTTGGAPDISGARSMRLAAPAEAFGETARGYLPLGMAALPDPDLLSGPLPRPAGLTTGKDGLDDFAPVDLFLDSRLARAGMRDVMGEAEYLLYQSVGEPPLCGLHALLPVEEIALIAAPDLVHRAWAPAEPLPVAPPPPLPPAEEPDWTRFRDCPTPPPDPRLSPKELVKLFTDRLIALDEDGAREALAPELLLTLPYGASVLALLGLEAAPVACAVDGPPCEPLGSLETEVRATLTLPSGALAAYLFGLTATLGDANAAARWQIAEITQQAVEVSSSDAARELAMLPLMESARAYRLNPKRLADLLTVQNALLSLCAGRRDAVAVLSLPEHFDRADVLGWQRAIWDTNTDSDGLALSYAAVYHPWVQLRETATPELALLRHQPPDGSACGVVAARELARGPWIAPANRTLRGVVGLTTAVGEADWVDLFDAHVNLLRQEPGRFTEMSAHTLSPDSTLLQLSVRRLLIYLRKLCLRRGMEYVFEPNDDRFRRRVEAGLSRTLDRLTAGGALAAYQVVTGESALGALNTLNDRDNGRFIVAIKVAPTQPIEFITLAMLRTGEGLLQVVEA